MPEQSILSRLKRAGNALRKQKSAPAKELVEVVSSVFAAMIGSSSKTLPNPDKVLAYQAGADGYNLYKDMLYKDTVIGHIFESRINELLSTDWEVKPFVERNAIGGKPTLTAVEQADHLLRIFNENEETSLDRLMETAFQESLAVGFSVTEPIWSVNIKAQLLEPIAFRLRNQDRFSFDTKWRLQLKPHRLESLDPVLVDPFRFIVMRRAGGSNNPYGSALCQRLYWLYFVKKKVMQFWAIYQERFGTPILDVSYKSGMEGDTVMKAAINTILESYGNSAGIQHDENIQLNLLEAKKAASSGYHEFIKYCDQAMTKAVQGQTLTSGEGDKGTQALGKVHRKTSDDILKRDAKFVRRVIGAQFIRVWTDLNYPNQPGYASIQFDVDPPEDLVSKGKVYTVALESGLEIGIDHYRQEFKIPPPADGEETLAPLSQEPALQPNPNNGPNGQGQERGEADSGLDRKPKKSFGAVGVASLTPDSSRFFFLETTRLSVDPARLKSRQRYGKIRGKGIQFLCDPNTNETLAVRFDHKLIPRAEARDFMFTNFADFAGKQPPPGVQLIQMGSTFHLHDPFRDFIEGLFSTMEPEIQNLIGDNPALRATVEQLITKKLAPQLNTRIPTVNVAAIEFAATNFATQLAVDVNRDRFDRYIDEYLDVHAFRPQGGKLSPVTRGIVEDTRNRLTAQTRSTVKQFKDGSISLEEAVGKMTISLRDVSAGKARQIAVTEVNEAASYASFKIIEDTGLRYDAYFLVDPISCQVCLEQAARNPYRVEEAKILGLPHPNCNDFWAFVPRI